MKVSDLNFNFRLETNEVLLHQAQTVLTDLRANSPLVWQKAISYHGSNPTDLLSDSTRLLRYYHKIWRPQRGAMFFLGTCISNPLRALIRVKPELEEAATHSVLCKTALAVINEFFVCLEYRDKLRKHIKTQRTIMDQCRAGFFYALVVRDGKQCSECKTKRRKLYIDHIKPLAHWGLSEFTNIQLLCFACNSQKSSHFKEE